MQNPRAFDPHEAARVLEETPAGRVQLVDVREPWEFEEFHLPGARLIPLTTLLDEVDTLDRERPVLVYCAVGQRSSAAAKLLAGRGFSDVAHIEGGVMAWERGVAVGPPDMGLVCLPEGAGELEVLAMAMTMERNLAGFYRDRATQTTSSDAAEVFSALAKDEVERTRRLMAAAQSIAPDATSEDIQARGACDLLRGGFTLETYLEEFGSLMGSGRGAVQAAMMFEVQAQDLYLRMADHARDAEADARLRSLADEARTRLGQLARMLESIGDD